MVFLVWKGGLPMPMTNVRKLARVLKVLVTITFVCNLIALVLVPDLVLIQDVLPLMSDFLPKIQWDIVKFIYIFGCAIVYLPNAWATVWGSEHHYVELTLFLFFCGVCTAVILWQARRVLNTILAGVPFQNANGISLRRAAVCCFLISAAALVRLLWGFWYYASIQPLLTYNALFIPVFFMGGLLCLVMSALFRQAAELKAENDLTI